MPRFAYSAYADTGRLVKGSIEADDGSRALDMLAQRGLTPVSISTGEANLPWWARELSFGCDGARIKPKELEAFFSSFASMLAAQFPLIKSIGFCRDQTRDLLMRRTLAALHDAVSNGSSLATAMRRSKKAFPDRIVSLIELGETSNTLPEVVQRIAQNLSDEAGMRREFRGALIYPVILLFMSALVMALIVFYLAPTLSPVFASADAEPPAALKAMSMLRTAILSWWPLLLSAFLGLGIAALLLKNTLVDLLRQFTMRIPILATYLRQRESLRLCQILHVMLASGAPLQKALQVCETSDLSPALRALARRTKQNVVEGGTLADMLTKSSLIDPMASALIEVGEEADRLPEVLSTIVSDLMLRTQRSLKQAMQLLTPVLTLLIGLSVGALILSTISAIMDLNDIAF